MKPRRAVAAAATAVLLPLAAAGCPGSPPAHELPALKPAPQGQGAPPASNAPMTLDHQIANLVAYAKLLGYVRYFHPSDEAAAADWEALAVSAVPRVEQARTPDELAAALQAVFAPVAPTLRVFTSGKTPSAPAELGAAQPSWIGWVHFGLGDDPSDETYASTRASNTRTPHPHPGALVQRVDAKATAGRRVHAKASLRAAVADAGSSARLMISWWSPETGTARALSQPVTAATWQDVEVVADVDRHAKHVAVGLYFEGDGKGGIDDVAAQVEGARAPLALDDAAFEDAKAGATPKGWHADGRSLEYRATATDDKPHGGKRAAEIQSSPLPVEPIAKPADSVLHADLGGGVEANVPMSLYVNAEGRTLPVGALAPERGDESADKRMARFDASDRAVRIADVALAWNVFQHFYPYFDAVKTDWAAELSSALTHAIADTDEKTFHTTLKRLVAAAHDGQSAVWRAVYDGRDGAAHPLRRFAPPIAWRVVEGKLVITAVGEGVTDVKVGDVVGAIDGKPADRALADTEALASWATPQYGAHRAAQVLLYGEKDETVTLALARGGEAKLTRTLPEALPEPRPAAVSDLAPGVVYVDPSRATDSELEAKMPKLVAAHGLVVDMRGYPRLSNELLQHLAGGPVHGLGWLVPKIERPDHQEMQFLPPAASTLEPLAPRIQAKVAFVADASSVGHAETWLGFVEGSKLGAIVGEPTAGTDGNRNDFALPGGYYVSFTGARVLKQDGSPIHGAGIAPTVPCAATVAGVAAGKDEALQCAVSAVK